MGTKIKLQLEYVINASPKLLYNRISTPAGLSEWFADDVNMNGEIYTFFWEKQEQEAELVSKKKENFVRFKWLEDEDDESYFEFCILDQELTGEVSLQITDFAEKGEENDIKDLWDKQISFLKRALGA
jgi:uncharacterized protein YndB with AHSA1/START domain